MSSDLVRRAIGFMKMGRCKPVWFETVAQKYPPLTFKAPKSARANGSRPKNSPEPIWRPPKLNYPEDKYVRKIYDAAPVELFRATNLCETSEDPRNAEQMIIKHQLELMETGRKPDEAFQMASDWFWEGRKQLEISEKIAREQSIYCQEQIDNCSWKKVQMRRTQPVGDAIRQHLLEEKAALIAARKAQNENLN